MVVIGGKKMERIKKLFTVALTLVMVFGITTGNTNALETLKVTSIVANTYVGDGQREVSSFDITVNDISLIDGLTAEDFDITGNVSSVPLDLNGQGVTEYEDDEISLSIAGNKITINAKAFNYGIDTWKVTCTKDAALSFSKSNVTALNTRTLDDAIRGTFTYAGLTREYALYLPKNSDGSTMKNVPLVVWNHGGGEYAGKLENALVANRGLTAWSEAGYDTAVLEIQVSNPNYSYFAAFDESKKSLIDQNNALQAALIKKLISEGTVDQNRVYVTGASSGGGATMRFVMQYPELFAGAIAGCSMDPIVWVHWNSQDSYAQIVANFEAAFQGQVYTWDEEKNMMIAKDVDTEALINLPIYFTHAQNDGTCSANSSKAMYEALNNLGAKDNQIKIWTDGEMADDGLAGPLLHWSWVKIFNHNEEGTPMNWLFKQTKEVVVEPSEPDTPNEPDTPSASDTPNQSESPEQITNSNVIQSALPDKTKKSVKTGDDSAVVLMIMTTVISLLGIRVVLKRKIYE